MRGRLIVAGIAAGLLLAAGCSSQAPEPAAPPVPATTQAQVAETTPAEPTPTPTPEDSPTSFHSESKNTDLKVGDTWEGVMVSVQLVEAKTVLEEYSGMTYTAVLVRTCSLVETISVSSDPWHVIDSDEGFIPAGWGVEGLDPAYPDYQPLHEGKCVKGWIAFDVPDGQKAVELWYESPEGSVWWNLKGAIDDA